VQAELNICTLLLRDLRKALIIVCTTAYPDYRAYVQVRFLATLNHAQVDAHCLHCAKSHAVLIVAIVQELE
jgi:hypothetical protein